MRNTVGLLLAAAILVGVTGVATAGDGTGNGGGPPPRAQNILGMVASAHQNASGVSGFGKLRYHSGPVMHANSTYAIYWVPAGYTMSSDYSTVIDRFLGDVAADSGKIGRASCRERV